MPRSERSSGRRGFGRLVAGALVPTGLVAASCVSLMSLENRSCPCATGYECCEATSTCVEPGESCPSNSGNGGTTGSGGTSRNGGASGSGATGGSQGGNSATGGNAGTSVGGVAGTRGGSSSQGGATSGAGGVAGEAGMGGVPEPEWRPVGRNPLVDAGAREPDFELAPDDTPYLAFRGCVDCEIPAKRYVAVVERFDGSRWRELPSDGLPAEVVASPELTISEDGSPFVLTDGQVNRFDGTRWVPFGAPLPGPTTIESNFQIDAFGAVWVTLFDSARQEISVVRSLGLTWEPIGLPVSGSAYGVRFVWGAGGSYLAHSGPTGGVFVREMTAGAWTGPELTGESVDVALALDGTLYVAIWQQDGVDVQVFSGAFGALTALGTLGSVSFAAPALEVAKDGTLYAVHLVEDFVNVRRFDGEFFRDVDSMGIGNGISPSLRLSSTSSEPVPYVAFSAGSALWVKKYE